MQFAVLDEWTWSSLFSALASRFGGDPVQLEEDAILRLIEAARCGDRAAGQRLYRQYVDRVFRTVRGMVRSDADAEEITQETMLKVLTSLSRYSPRPGTRFIAWVTTVAVNTGRRRFRRRTPELKEPDQLLQIPDERANVERDVDNQRQRRALLLALTDLTDREREIVSMRYGSELDAGEIAQALALEAPNVHKILERIRERLGARIESLLISNREAP